MSTLNKSRPPSSKPSKDVPDIELTSIFRGRYDLGKNKKDGEISLDNAKQLFDVIQKKNDKLYRDSHIKMFSRTKTFSFCDQKSFSKVHHHIPYFAVKRFFVLHKNPTMVIMGIHHKMHRWFFVFQFSNKEDLTSFCDEIEGEKRRASIIENGFMNEMEPMTIDVSHGTMNMEERNSYGGNPQQTEEIDFDDNYYEPDLKPEQFAVLEMSSPLSSPSRASSRNSMDDNFDGRIHCDNMAQSKIHDLLLKRESLDNDNIDDWDEQLTFLDSPIDISIPHLNKTGPIYMYTARHKVNYLKDLFDNEEKQGFPLRDKETVKKDTFENFKPKMIQNDFEPNEVPRRRLPDTRVNKIDTFDNHEPKMNNGGNVPDIFDNHESKLNKKRTDENNFHNHEPKRSQKEEELIKFDDYEPNMNTLGDRIDTFNNHQPKMNQQGNVPDTYNNHSPKMNKGKDVGDHFDNHVPKMIESGNVADTFKSHQPKMNQPTNVPDTYNNHSPKMNKGGDVGDNFNNHVPKKIEAGNASVSHNPKANQQDNNINTFNNHEPKMNKVGNPNNQGKNPNQRDNTNSFQNHEPKMIEHSLW